MWTDLAGKTSRRLGNKGGGCEGTVISRCHATNPGYDDIQITAVGAVTAENCYLADGPFAWHLRRDRRSQCDTPKQQYYQML